MVADAYISNKRSKADFTVGNIKYIFTNISEGTAFLLQGLTYNEEVKLKVWKLKNSVQYDIIVTREN